MDIREIFEEKIKIDDKVMSIDSLFNNEIRVKNTDYKPSYQRNYVWDDEKATFFIESILLGTEIPPLVYFKNGEKVEIIDGRQRYQTILRFKNNDFKLRKKGLHILGNNRDIANKAFKDLSIELQEMFYDTKLRLIEFSFHSRKDITDDIEDLVKKEIFQRYNSGITPLKPAEVDNAVYYQDDLNSYIKEKLKSEEETLQKVSEIFSFSQDDISGILKKIRQLLVIHEIPIKYYSIQKQTVISRFYDALFAKIDENEIESVYQNFLFKVNLLTKIKEAFSSENLYNKLISEVLFWAFSILENEKINLSEIDNEISIKELVSYLEVQNESFSLLRSSFAKELFNRYFTAAKFFEDKFNVKFNLYLYNSPEFKQINKNISPPVDEKEVSFNDLRINKPEPSSISITDIIRLMKKERFLIRPLYQRKEVINQRKSSAIIESILLGIKLPPIFIFKREDKISEVLDGQQRLLSILGYIQEKYLDENNEMVPSDKDGYSLYLKNGILTNLHTYKFKDLSVEEQQKIKDFELWLIEIDYKSNNHFVPIDLFFRLNDKPYPIKDDTFEMWNSYISRDIIDTIKSTHDNNNSWFYFRKNNSRMEDENIYTALSYFQYCRSVKKLKNTGEYPEEIDIYKVGSKIMFRVKSKPEISKILLNTTYKENFIKAIHHFEFDFLRKVKELLTEESDSSNILISKSLDDIFMLGNSRRTQQSFYALWYFLFDIPIESIISHKEDIKSDLKKLFLYMSDIGDGDKSTFENYVYEFKNKYITPSSSFKKYNIGFLEEVAKINLGIKKERNSSSSIQGDLFENIVNYNFINKFEFLNFKIESKELKMISIDLTSNSDLAHFFESNNKILISRDDIYGRFNVVITDDKLAFGDNIIGLSINRPTILPKYILALLSSKYCFYKYRLRKNHSKNLTVSDIANIEIPIIPIQEQDLFELIVDYTMNCQPHSKMALFYEKVKDAMVYELFMEETLPKLSMRIQEYVSLLLPLKLKNREQRIKTVEEFYEILSSPEHQLGADLIRMMSAPIIRNIESKI